MTTFQTNTYYDYKDAYNDIIAQIAGSAALNSAQIADCIKAIQTIAPYPTPTGSVSNTPVTNPTPTPVTPPPVYNPQTPSNFAALP